MKDRDEQHYDHEESEYHFSDDDVSYEVETDTSKPVAPEPEKKNPMAALSQSKRMMISLVVFLGLVFVVYKMVSPGTTVPSTEISPVAVAQPIMQEIAPPPLPHTTPTPEVSVPAQAEATPVAIPAQAAAPVQPAVAAPAPAATTTTTTTTVASTPAPAPVQPVAAAPQAAPAPVPAAPLQPVAQAVPPAPAQPQPSATPPAPVAPVAAASPAPAAAAPAPTQQTMPVATTVVTSPAVTPTNTDAAIAAMAATNEKLMNQLQAEYSQKVNDFSNQNKALQENMQALNSRVAGLESQLTQLVQTLSRQTGMGGPTTLNVVPAQQPAPIVQPKINYNVQAIIPGRAWLKSDNGETLTVAEGDSIRELGRVTKIDPYDGIVEVNTGSKTVSISYGSGG